MGKLLLYKPPQGNAPLLEFLAGLDDKLRIKLLWQLAYLSRKSLVEMKEPHVKHFVLEKYSSLFELREKNRVLVRVIFQIRDNGDILLLAPFIKKHSRDTMKALELSLRMLTHIEQDPRCAVNFLYQGGEAVMNDFRERGRSGA